ncbi:hypothetical protein BYT27DRAFT_7082218 [Phlegmacium glaucopus]|nr:hypothetical protein BYT27DRAFT_7082218 [Phlegmacium glaucopus]
MLQPTPFVNPNTTEDQAIQLLKNIWHAGNEADKVMWQQQNIDDTADLTECHWLQSEADVLRVQGSIDDEESLRKEEMNKNKMKYIPIPNRDVLTIAPVIASNYAIRKMEKGLYVKLWYYTNAGLDEAFHTSNMTNDEVMVML